MCCLSIQSGKQRQIQNSRALWKYLVGDWTSYPIRTLKLGQWAKLTWLFIKHWNQNCYIANRIVCVLKSSFIVCLYIHIYALLCVLGVAGVFSELSGARGRDHRADDGQSTVAVWFEHRWQECPCPGAWKDSDCGQGKYRHSLLFVFLLCPMWQCWLSQPKSTAQEGQH